MLRNIVNAFLANGYSVALGLLVIPYYLHHLGPEAFSVYAVSVTVVTVLLLMDGGGAKVFAREASLHKSGVVSARQLFALKNAMTIVLGAVCFLIILLSDWFSSLVSQQWFQSSELSIDALQLGVWFVLLQASIQLFSSIWQEGLVGLEQHKWLYKWNILLASTRHIGGAAIVGFDNDIVLLMAYFALVSALAWVVLFLKFRSLFDISVRIAFSTDFSALKARLGLGLSIFATSGLSVLVRQADRVLFSGLLVMEVYSYYAIGAQVATGLFIISAPIVSILTPRLVLVLSSREKLRGLYGSASDLLALLIVPAAVVLSVYSDLVVKCWFGVADSNTQIAEIMALLTPAYMLIGLCALLRPLQLALGDLSLQVWGSVIFFLLRIPIFIFSAYSYGVYGALISLITLNLIYFVLWPYLVHKKFGFDRPFDWAMRYAFGIALSFLLAGFSRLFLSAEDVSRSMAFLICAGVFSANVFILFLVYRPNREQLESV